MSCSYLFILYAVQAQNIDTLQHVQYDEQISIDSNFQQFLLGCLLRIDIVAAPLSSRCNEITQIMTR